eukprot:6150823-Amphidinium_carterae.7
MQQQLSFIEALAHPSLPEVFKLIAVLSFVLRCSSLCAGSNRCNIASQLGMTPRAMEEQNNA